MRLVLRFLGVMVFVLGSPICIIALAIGLSGLSASALTSQLARSRIYETVHTQFGLALDAAANSPQSGDMKLAAPVIKNIVTAELLQQKVEAFISDSSAWLSDKTSKPPVITFVELKEIALKQYPDLAKQVAVASAKAPQAPNPEFDYGLPHPPEVSALERAIDHKLTFAVGDKLFFVKELYKIARFGFVVLALIVLGGFGLVLIFSEGIKSAFRWVGFTLGMASLWNLPFLLFIASPAAILAWVLSAVDSPVIAVLPTILRPMLAHVAIFDGIVVVAMGTVGLVAFIVSFILKD